MDLKEIQTLIKFVAGHEVDEVEIERKDFKLSIKKTKNQAILTTASSAPVHMPVQTPVQQVVAQQIAAPVAAEAPAATEPKADNLVTIKSPMIGTFYRTPNPDSPTFVNIGDEIKPGKVICIIEAMKLFNEIESEISGKIVKILVDNATPVEYDQPLFLVEPA